MPAAGPPAAARRPHAPPCRAVTGARIRCPQLPGALAALPALQFLDLKCNALRGTIPPAWTAEGAFLALDHLNLGAGGGCGSRGARAHRLCTAPRLPAAAAAACCCGMLLLPS